jgi:hypothetical protein
MDCLLSGPIVDGDPGTSYKAESGANYKLAPEACKSVIRSSCFATLNLKPTGCELSCRMIPREYQLGDVLSCTSVEQMSTEVSISIHRATCDRFAFCRSHNQLEIFPYS